MKVPILIPANLPNGFSWWYGIARRIIGRSGNYLGINGLQDGDWKYISLTGISSKLREVG